MKKIIINENQRGLLFKNGKYVKMLTAGKYLLCASKQVEVCSLTEQLIPVKCAIGTLIADPAVQKEVVLVEVKDEQMALHFVNGKFKTVLPRGEYAFWQVNEKHEFKIVDISSPYVSNEVPEYIFNKIPSIYYVKIEVAQHQKARLYFNRKLEKILDAGTYYFWKNGVKVEADFLDTRLTQLNIVGQEILTQDKVSVRINFVCNYKITDFVKVTTEIGDFTEQLHVIAQLAIRDYVAKYKLDEILENKEGISKYVMQKLKEKEQELFVLVNDGGVKDIILPGEIREIMNTVLIAEKRAQANVITRREEVASTRSLLNTAKLMEENPTLYKLKELEYVERIFENVNNVNLNGNADLLTQLTSLVTSSKR